MIHYFPIPGSTESMNMTTTTTRISQQTNITIPRLGSGTIIGIVHRNNMNDAYVVTINQKEVSCVSDYDSRPV